MTLLGGAAAAVAGGIGVIAFQFSPPLSAREEQGIAIGIGGCVLGVIAVLGAFVLPNGAQVAAERDRLAWLFLRLKGGEQSAMLGTADGASVPLRLDRAGSQLTGADEQKLFAAIAARHPGVAVGYSPDAERQFQTAAHGAAGAVTRVRRQWFALLATPVVVALIANFILHALDL
jgi:hypothetical protein